MGVVRRIPLRFASRKRHDGAMPDASTYVLFCAAALALLIVPGPAVLYIVARSVEQGRRGGLISVAGIHLGTLVHVGAASMGLSAVLVRSALAFTIVKIAGAAHLVALGLRRLLRPRIVGDTTVTRATLSRVFWQGTIVNVLNPKTAVFFFAFLPQFVEPAGGSAGLQILLLGITFVVLGAMSDGVYALLAGTLGPRLLHRPRAQTARERVSGGVCVALGVATAFGADTPRRLPAT